MKNGATNERIKVIETTINVCSMDRGGNFVARTLSETMKLIGFAYSCPVQKGHYERINWKFSDAYVPKVIPFYSSTGKIGFFLTFFGKAKVASVKRSMINLFKVEVKGVIDQSN